MKVCFLLLLFFYDLLYNIFPNKTFNFSEQYQEERLDAKLYEKSY